MDDFVRSRNTGSNRASSWRRGGQRTKFSERAKKELGPPTNSQASKSLPTSVDRTGAPLASIYVHKITLKTLLDDEKAEIRDCQYVASYNWLDKKTATILVPGTTIYSSALQTLTIKLIQGSPPAYLPPKHVPTLKQDSGTYFRDPNAARYPLFPLEPAIRALLISKPDFDCSNVDIVGCGSTLGCLVSAARGEERTFHFGVERIGNTVFLVRQGASPKEVMEGVRGYGHTFPEAYTTWDADVKGSASHQRLTQYRFGNLHCLIRSEIDGYFPDVAVRKCKADGPAILSGDDASRLQSAAASLSVSEKIIGKPDKLVVQIAGHAIPQDVIFDLKTRSARRDVDIDEFLPRLWVNQIPNFIIARHDSGKFQDIQKKDVRAAVKDWEQKNEDMLGRLHSVLSQLIKMTEQADCSRIQVIREMLGPLHIRKATQDWSALPTKLKMKWEGKAPAEETLSDSDSEEEDQDDYLKF